MSDQQSLERSFTKRAGLLVAVVVVLSAAWVAHWPVLFNQWLYWDDRPFIWENPRVSLSWENLGHHWTRPTQSIYIPLTLMVWSALGELARWSGRTIEQSAMLFHAASVMVHGLAGVGALLLLRRIIPNLAAATAGAVLFVVHPLQVESVAWASALKDVLMGALSLLACWQYVLAVQKRDAGLPFVGGHYAAALVLAVAAMLSKPTAVVLPLMLLSLDFLLSSRGLKTRLLWIVPFVVATLPIVIVTRFVQDSSAIPNVPVWQRPLPAAFAVGFYLQKLVVPLDLVTDYGHTPAKVVRSAWGWIVAAVGLVVMVLVVMQRRHRPVVLTAGLLMLLPLLPVLGLVSYHFLRISVVADHYMYLAMIGPALLVAWLLRDEKRTVVWLGVCLVAAVLVLLSNAQARHWRTTTTLFEHTLRVNLDSVVAWTALAHQAVNQRDYPRAEEMALRALELDPESADAYNNLGVALAMQYRVPEAFEAFERAVRFNPRQAEFHANLAGAHAELGRFEQAVVHYRRALELDPNQPAARLMLPRILQVLETRRSD